MQDEVTRRSLLGVVGAGAVAALAGADAMAQAVGAGGEKKLRVIAISCSPRPSKTTAAGLKVCLEAAAKVSGEIQTELIELAGMDIPVFDPAGPGSADFKKIASRLTQPDVAAIVIGTPVYFSGMSPASMICSRTRLVTGTSAVGTR